MSNYMVDIDLPEAFTEEFIELIPEQRSHVNRLISDGTLSSYTLAMDRSKLWVTVPAESEEQVMDLLAEMPMIAYMRINIFELAYYETAFVGLATVSLN